MAEIWLEKCFLSKIFFEQRVKEEISWAKGIKDYIHVCV